MNFEGKAVLITGSSRGIGKATARAFLNSGARVAVNGGTIQSANRAIKQLANPGSLIEAAGDVSTLAGCESTVTKAIKGLDGLDILVNAAGICESVSIEQSHELLWDQTIDTNLKGTFFCSQFALAALRKNSGVIINVASDAGLLGEKNLSIYCASKGGVVNLTRAMALELAPQVRVNCVCPGYVDTDMVRRDHIDRSADPAAAEQSLKDFAPMKRIATPAEIAQAILYLSSRDAGFITGAALQIDGGTTAGH